MEVAAWRPLCAATAGPLTALDLDGPREQVLDAVPQAHLPSLFRHQSAITTRCVCKPWKLCCAALRWFARLSRLEAGD
eukprot:SAG11_NODE_3171_length_2636_cov_1.373670_2_plen_78_part_00